MNRISFWDSNSKIINIGKRNNIIRQSKQQKEKSTNRDVTGQFGENILNGSFESLIELCKT